MCFIPFENVSPFISLLNLSILGFLVFCTSIAGFDCKQHVCRALIGCGFSSGRDERSTVVLKNLLHATTLPRCSVQFVSTR